MPEEKLGSPSEKSKSLEEDMKIDENLLRDTVEFLISMPPVSIQSKRDKKEELKNIIIEKTKNIPIIYTGEVSITVEWYCDEEKRKLTDKYADIDNILKPLLDSLVGSDGIMVDDTQVQHIQCYWIGGWDDGFKESFRITIKSDMDFIKYKNGLVFLELEHPIYLPCNIKNMTCSKLKKHWEYMVSRFINLRDTGDIANAPLCLCTKMHYTRIKDKGFEILELKNSDNLLKENKAIS